MAVEARAPGKLFLFGEHAILFGQPAVLIAVNRGVVVSADETGRRELVVKAMGRVFRGGLGDEAALSLLPRHVAAALKLYSGEIGDRGLAIEIKSDIPFKGLGSSAAVTVALVAALDKLLRGRWSVEESVEKGYRIKLMAEGGGSIGDIAAAAHGGIVVVGRDGRPRRLPAGIPRGCAFVAVYTGVDADTMAAVKHVRHLVEEGPSAFSRLIGVMGEVAERGVEALVAGDASRLGALMNVAHGLLAAFGLSNEAVSRAVEAVKPYSLGAKISGAGWGDCIVALVERPRLSELAVALKWEGLKYLVVDSLGEGVSVREL